VPARQRCLFRQIGSQREGDRRRHPHAAVGGRVEAGTGLGHPVVRREPGERPL